MFTILKDIVLAFRLRWTDDMIDVMIQERGVKAYRPGMGRPDYNRLRAFGGATMGQFLQAEKNLQRASTVVH